MLRIAICDDNKLFLGLLYRSLSKWTKYQYIEIEILGFENGEDLLCNIEANGHFQIVILEIELKRSDGLAIATQILNQSSSTMIMFISSYDHYSKRVYKVHPFYFFTKPIRYPELSSVMKSALSRLDVEYQAFCFSHRMVYYSIPIKEIIYFFSEKRRIGVVSLHQTYYFYGKLEQIEEQLNKFNTFLRIHKSFIVNKRYISIYQNDYIQVKGNEKLPISRSKRKSTKEALIKFWKYNENGDDIFDKLTG